MNNTNTTNVIPVQAGIHQVARYVFARWILACTGMTSCFFLLPFLFACASSEGNKSAVKLYKQENLPIGTSVNEITKKYGEYSSKWIDQNGDNLYQYSYNRAHYDFISYLPIINHFGWVNSQNYEVLLIFDSKNQLIKEKKFFDHAKSRNGLVCNPDVYSCIGKVE